MSREKVEWLPILWIRLRLQQSLKEVINRTETTTILLLYHDNLVNNIIIATFCDSFIMIQDVKTSSINLLIRQTINCRNRRLPEMVSYDDYDDDDYGPLVHCYD